MNEIDPNRLVGKFAHMREALPPKEIFEDYGPTFQNVARLAKGSGERVLIVEVVGVINPDNTIILNVRMPLLFSVEV